MMMIRIPMIACLLALAAISLADSRILSTPPPASPKEFHTQEMARIASRLQDETHSPLTSVQDDFDVVYYELDLDVRDFSGETIHGNVLILARVLTSGFDEMILDLCSDLTIDSVVVDNEPASSSPLPDHRFAISLNQTYDIDDLVEVTVHYWGTPCRTSRWTSVSYYNRSSGGSLIPSIATLSEPYGARDWWPSKNVPADKADSARISITVSDTIVATSNGVLESVTTLPPDSRTYTWFESHPIATYLVSIAATNYTEWTDWYVGLEGDSMPIVHYAYPERLAHSQVSWDGLPEMLGILAGLYGEFPFIDEKYGHTMTNFAGAMEHQCNTSYGSNITNGGHYYDWIVVHEAAHQYWGDEVTLHTWPDIWLNEGFASYTEALWVEQTQGNEAFRNYLVSSAGLSVVDPSGPVYNPSDLFSSNTVYDKGAWILHILRGVVRHDSLYFSALREYRSRHQDATATTAQFLGDVSDAIGFDVTPYLYAYLYLTNRPHFSVGFGSGVVDGIHRTAVQIEQTQTNPDTTFRTRLDLAFSGGTDTTITVENSEWSQVYLLDLSYTPSTLTVDPDNWVLEEVNPVDLTPVILNTELSEGLELSDYADTLVAIGGTPPYAWEIASGSLPAGIELSPEGVLSGAPTEYGSFVVTFRTTDQTPDVAERDLTIDVQGLPHTPQHLTCTLATPDSILLRWLPAENADAYEIYRATDPDMSDSMLVTTTTDTLFTELIPSDSSYVDHFYRVFSTLIP